MSQAQQLSTFYAELDCLLDTRLSMIYEYGEKAVEVALQEGYLTRLIDNFNNIDTEAYNYAYAHRTKSILKNAVVTPIIPMMRDFAIKTVQTAINSPFKLKPNIIVNAYPYTFTPEEEEVLIITLANAMGNVCDIRLMYAPMEDIKPEWIKNTCAVAVMYRYMDWVEHHASQGHFNECICPDVTLIGPKLYFNGLPKKENLKGLSIDRDDPFTYLEDCVEPLIKLITYPVSFFSININDGDTTQFKFRTSSETAQTSVP